ncbi:MAG: glycoside hydrolase family 5 protein [Treponema sp.]|nr:glycoside hydrolase family 5 protein [Treponema sp.]
MKRLLLSLGVTFVLTGALFAAKPVFNSKNAVKDTGKKSFNSNSALETVNNMKTGWNLGNTFDATNGKDLYSETSWGQPKTTKKMIDTLAASGIKTIRIPVSWHNHLIDKNYTIDPEWMKRVKEVVDWAIAADMYVIINSHHDCWSRPSKMPYGKGYYPNTVNYEESERFLTNVWSQICLAFNKGYDEHLVFETMNEPRLCGTSHEWWFDKNAKECQDAAATLNKLNQVTLDTIRASKGNNTKRFVMIPGLQASPDSAFAAEFKMPDDGKNGTSRLILSAHMYSPYKFAMESPGVREFTPQLQNELTYAFKRLNDNFVKKGYAVVIGEYGATNKDNLEERVKWFHAFLKYTRQYGITSCLWDNGTWEVSGTDYNEHFGYFDRRAGKWFFPEILKAIQAETK